jgi:outer membrane protein TolC
LQAKRSGYRSNLFTSLDVLDAESKVYFAKKMLSASLYELILHYLKLKQLTGELNEQELEALTQWLVAA